MCLTAKNFASQEENMINIYYYPNRREIPLIRKTGWGTERAEGQMDRKERERGREDAVLYEKGG